MIWRGARIFFTGLWALAPLCVPFASAQDHPLDESPIVSAAQKEVAITATFAGDELFVYGAVDRSRRTEPADGDLDVIIVVEGPSEPIVVRKKTWVAGMWINTLAVRVAAAPSYYAVASTRPLSQFLRPEDDATYHISLDKAVLIAGVPFSADDPEEFRQAAIRLRASDDLYVELPDGVTLVQDTLYEARFRLPANIIEGEYVASVYLVRGRRVRGRQEFVIPVRRRGIEQFLYNAATQTPLLYAIGTLLTALIAGFLASELFRRLRRG